MNREYKEYLNSDLWKATRVMAFKKHGDICICGDIATEIHHLTYSRLGRERLDDLLPLCPSCHGNYHVIENKKKNCEPKDDDYLISMMDEEKNRQLTEYHRRFAG